MSPPLETPDIPPQDHLSSDTSTSQMGDEYVSWDDIDRASKAWRIADGAVGTPYDEFRGKYLPLPAWYDASLPPLSQEYLSQQDRLWQMMIGEDTVYNPAQDEQTGLDDRNILVQPGFYRDSPERAGDHLIAMGHIVQKSGLIPGNRVLEYGAGFGQIALTLARLGITVDTVDIDRGFCSAVQKQADWFNVPLTAYSGEFGDNPTGEKYDAILFYEAFHHARKFVDLIVRAREILKPGGKIIMAGEPILPKTDEGFAKTCPYPWGIRLEVDVASIVRFRRWYELGFQEEFLFETFDSFGFTPKKYPGHISHYATVYTFTLRSDGTFLSHWQSSPEILETWHGPEPDGRWTKALSLFPVERAPGWSTLRISCVNHHNRPQTVTFELGDARTVVFDPRESKDVLLPRDAAERILRISCDPIQPSSYGIVDDRPLGLFIKKIEYLE